MADNFFNKLGQSELSDTAIEGIIEEEIKSHKKEEVSLPIIKLKLPPKEEVIKIKKKEKTFDKFAEKFLTKDAGELTKVPELPPIKLPDSLTSSQKLRKRYRYRRFGMPYREVKVKREIKPLPEVKKEDIKRLRWFKFKKNILGFELILPAVILFLLFSWFPIIKTFMISFTKFETINKVIPVGFYNFYRILNDPKLWASLTHSFILCLIVLIFGTWIPFLLSLYVYEMRKGSGIIKTLYFIPFLIPAVPSAILWRFIYNEGFGVINSVLSLIFNKDIHIGFLTNPNLVLISIAIVFIWKSTGWAMLVYIAGLNNIPKVFFEEASLYGAGIKTKIKDILLPQMKSIIIAVVFIQLINTLQVFTEVYIMTNGGPANSSEVIATYIYKKAFLYMDIGYASGIAVFFFILLISATLLKVSLSNKRS